MDKEIIISDEEISNHIFKKLTEKGFAITNNEADEIADIVFDYLEELGVLEDITEGGQS